jgi:hypothetical protein
MKVENYIEKLKNSEKHREFLKKNSKAYFSAGFFVIDFIENNNLHQIDYYLPKEKKMATFILDGEEINFNISEPSNNIVPEEITGKINMDLDLIKRIIEDEMKNKMITKEIHKIIAIVYSSENKLLWSLNCITSDMAIVKATIEDETHFIDKFELVNLFDVVKKI